MGPPPPGRGVSAEGLGSQTATCKYSGEGTPSPNKGLAGPVCLSFSSLTRGPPQPPEVLGTCRQPGPLHVAPVISGTQFMALPATGCPKCSPAQPRNDPGSLHLTCPASLECKGHIASHGESKGPSPRALCAQPQLVRDGGGISKGHQQDGRSEQPSVRAADRSWGNGTRQDCSSPPPVFKARMGAGVLPTWPCLWFSPPGPGLPSGTPQSCWIHAERAEEPSSCTMSCVASVTPLCCASRERGVGISGGCDSAHHRGGSGGTGRMRASGLKSGENPAQPDQRAGPYRARGGRLVSQRRCPSEHHVSD